VEQARCDGAAEALLLGMGRAGQVGRQPAQLAPQGGEARAAVPIGPERPRVLHAPGSGREYVQGAAAGTRH
jgi:hypothetical protein